MCLLGVIDPFSAILQQSTSISDARLVGIVCPTTRADKCGTVLQIQSRNDRRLTRKVTNHVVTAKVVPVLDDHMVFRKAKFLRDTTHNKPTSAPADTRGELLNSLRHENCATITI